MVHGGRLPMIYHAPIRSECQRSNMRCHNNCNLHSAVGVLGHQTAD
jgi:hypothetical protein